MNTNMRLLIFTVILLLSLGNTSYGQETHYVTLFVNTAQITPQNADQVCYFRGQIEGTNTQDFNIEVGVGDTIIWDGISSSSPDNDVVNIKSINYQGGDNVFDRNVLNGDGEFPEKVLGNVQGGTEGFVEKYVIYFTVLNNGERRGGTFHIDPKITVKK